MYKFEKGMSPATLLQSFVNKSVGGDKPMTVKASAVTKANASFLCSLFQKNLVFFVALSLLNRHILKFIFYRHARPPPHPKPPEVRPHDLPPLQGLERVDPRKS